MTTKPTTAEDQHVWEEERSHRRRRRETPIETVALDALSEM